MGLLTGPAVPLTCGFAFSFTLAGGFQRLLPQQALSLWPAIPVGFRGLTRPGHGVYVLISVGGIGLEPTTFAMSTQCSNQLSYPPDSRAVLYTPALKMTRRSDEKMCEYSLGRAASQQL